MIAVARLDVRPAAGVARPSWWVRLEATDGTVGWGEAAPHPGFGGGAAATQRALAGLERFLGRPLDALFEGAAAGAPEVDFALALAAGDALARRAGQPLAATLCAAHAAFVDAHALVHDAATARAALAAGARSLKVKVGGDLDAADALLAAVRAAAPRATLRVDANAAWTRAQAAAALDRLARHDLAWIEQPCAALADLAWLAARTAVPIAADESVGVDPAGAMEVAAVVVLKPAFLGAPRRALSLAAEAARRGVGVCVTHALESPIGRAGALHVAAALADGGVHGVGGAGPITVPPSGGLGISP